MTHNLTMAAGQNITAETPQQATDEQIAHLRLIRTPNIGPMTFDMLMRRYGSAADALRAVPDLARRGGRSLKPASRELAEAELAANSAAGATLLFKNYPGYPERLASFDDTPPVLSAIGDVELLNRPMIAITGSREPSNNAKKLAETFARELAEAGYVVVAGLACGIDAAAHYGALSGSTIAVLPGGIDNVYPPQTADLRGRIASQGLLVAEMPPGTEPTPRHFPIRNRVIASLVLGTVIIEASDKDGAMITARETSERGREAMAVPGYPLDPRSEGGNHLIRAGSTLVRNVADILECVSTSASAAHGSGRQ